MNKSAWENAYLSIKNTLWGDDISGERLNKGGRTPSI